MRPLISCSILHCFQILRPYFVLHLLKMFKKIFRSLTIRVPILAMYETLKLIKNNYWTTKFNVQYLLKTINVLIHKCESVSKNRLHKKSRNKVIIKCFNAHQTIILNSLKHKIM